MKKITNALVMVVICFFSSFVGIFTNYQNNQNKQNENDYVQTLKNQIESLQQSFLSDWTTTNSNRINNECDYKTVDDDLEQEETNFNNFYQLHTVATNKINNCDYLSSTACGYTLLSGNIPALAFSFDNESALVTYYKKKSGEKRLFDLTLSGNKIVEGFDALFIQSIHYLDGRNATYKTAQGLVQCSQYRYEQLSGWNATDIFLLPNSLQAQAVDESQIVWFGFNEHDQQYLVKLKLNPISNSNFEGLIRMCTPNLDSVTITTMEMSYKTDQYANFISIYYHVTLEVNLIYANLRMIGKIDVYMSEDFDNINTSPVVIKNPFA